MDDNSRFLIEEAMSVFKNITVSRRLQWLQQTSIGVLYSEQQCWKTAQAKKKNKLVFEGKYTNSLNE